MQAHILSLRPEEKRIITEAKRKRKVICESKSDIEQRLISDIIPAELILAEELHY